MAKKLPAYLKLRNGRPRWEPGPMLRAQGIHGQDLKDANGQWLDTWAAARRAEELNAEIKAQREPGQRRRRDRGGERTCEALWKAFKTAPEWLQLAKSTRLDYEVKASVWLAEFGAVSVPAIQKAHMRTWWEELYRERGHAMANGTIAVARRALSYATLKGWISVNPASELRLISVPPRTVLITPSEVLCLVRTADGIGLPSVGDAVVLALHTGQRQGDVLGLELHNLRLERATEEWVDLRTGKTNARIRVPATPVLTERLADMQRRRHANTVVSLTERRLILTEAGSPYAGDYFRKQWAIVREAAGKELPTLREKQFLDLRDTAITRLALAGCTVMQIRAITGHSMRTIHDVLKHYLVLDDALARAAIKQLTSWMEAEGIAI